MDLVDVPVQAVRAPGGAQFHGPAVPPVDKPGGRQSRRGPSASQACEIDAIHFGRDDQTIDGRGARGIARAVDIVTNRFLRFATNALRKINIPELPMPAWK